MKKAVVLGDRRAAVVDVADPQPTGDWVLVKVHAAPMCAEYKSFIGEKPVDFLGHEAAGEVVAIAQPGRVRVGDRVVAMPLHGCSACTLCRAGDYIHCQHAPDFTDATGSPEGRATMAQLLLKPSWLLMPIPDEVSYERASLACCSLGPSFGAFQTIGVTAYDTILIAGAGPVGLGAVVNARYRGARVIVAESVPWRVERARQLGASAVVDPRETDVVNQILSLTGGRGVDYALDCAGNVHAERLCIDATRRKGKVAFIGECNADLAIRVSPDLIRKGLSVIGSWHYNLNDFPKVMQVVRESPLVDLLISHVLPMSSLQEAFELSASHNTAKIILQPWL